VSSVFRVWLERKGKHIIGKGGVEILEAINRFRSITEAAEKIDMSYKYVWDHLARMEEGLGQPVINTRRGGRFGGGGAELTEAGKVLLREYRRVKDCLTQALSDDTYWEAISLKISARNQLKGVVKQITKGVVSANVKIEVKVPVTITAVITKEATEELGLEVGKKVQAVIKATEVMIAKE